MSPGKTSKPQCRSGDELGSIRKPIALRPGLTATVLTCGKDTPIRCIQRLFMPTCVSPARKLPFAVGNSSQSADQITAWHANGSLKLKTLHHDTSVLPRNRNYYAATSRQEDLVSDRKSRVGSVIAATRNRGWHHPSVEIGGLCEIGRTSRNIIAHLRSIGLQCK
jgi:hypothetical protein